MAAVVPETDRIFDQKRDKRRNSYKTRVYSFADIDDADTFASGIRGASVDANGFGEIWWKANAATDVACATVNSTGTVTFTTAQPNNVGSILIRSRS